MEDKEDAQLHILEGEIVGIKFGLATHKEISTASVSGFPISHSSQLTNPFLGLPLEFGKCDSCGTSEPGKCEGHFGYIELPIPIYHPSHVSELKRMLSLLCLKCLKLKNNQTRSSGMAERLFACCEEASQISIKEVKTTDGANNLQLKFPSRQRQTDWSFLERYGFRYGNDFTRTLLPYEVNEMLKRISQETRRKLSRKGFFPQDGYIMKYVPVPPNCLSALDISDGVNVMSSDLSISMLKKVLKQVEIIRSSRSGEPNFESHEVEANDLQSAVDQYLQVRGTVKSAKDVNERFGIHKESNGSSTKAWLEKMKTLFIRKGSGFSSRSVITGDAYKRVNEIGIPFEIAQRITFEEKVNSHNVQYLQELVDNKSCLTYRDGSSTFSLREGSKGHTFLRPGQVVHRRIMDGDMVFINRPPTTHKHSLQALSVYVHDGHTVKINPLICGPLSADFDGDCIHLFYPQSLAAKAEVLELFSVEKQLLSSHSGNLNLQLTSDSLLSLKTMFKAYFLDRKAAQQLAMFVSSSLPQPAVKSCCSGLIWTAQQILQTALPSQFDCIGERYLISNGEVVNADFTRDVVQSVINEVVISIFFEKGPDAVFKFFNSLQPLLMEYIFCEGFSVGLEDFYMSRTAMDGSRGDFKVISSLLSQLRSTYNQLMELQLENHIRCAKLPVTKFILRSSTIGDLIEYRSESAMTKVVQQIGFLGLQISDRGKFYTKTLVEEMASHFESKYPPDIDYPSAKHGFIESCFFHGLDPYEAMVHSISSREVMVRSTRGLSEPGTLFKNLMAILRDVIICYDGTVRNVCSNSIIQFEYGVKAGIKAQSLFPAGEPVGVLAATAMSNPAYKAVLDSTPSSNSSWEQMKEILQCRVNFKNDVTDRRVILYFNYCGCGKLYCQEKATYLVKNHLEKVILKSIASCFMIEYRSPQSITDATVVGHIHLKKMKLQELKVNMEAVHNKCKETIFSFGKKKKNGSLYKKIEVAFSECCSFECADERSGMPCLSFFWKDNTEIHLERSIQLFADEVYHVLLDTVIKGDPRISSANIIWVSPDTSTWIRNPSRNQKGELALDVLTEKSAVKESGDAWRVVLDSCIPVLHMIDTTRSIPYAIKQVQELLGISCAFDQAVQRLSSSVTKVAKGVLKEHLILLANSMTCAGNLVGFTTGGYKALSHSLDVQVPFTEATLYTPRKCFERAAEKCHTDALSSVVAACAWGKHVAVGTGSKFDLIWDQKETCLNPKSSLDVYELLNMVRSSANGEPATACLGAEVDDLMPDDDMDDWNLSPERDFGSEKPIFEDGDEFKKFLDNQPADWEKVSHVEKGVSDGGNWGGDKDKGIDNDESWSSWGRNRTETQNALSTKVQEEPDGSNGLDTVTPWQLNDNSSWGTKKNKSADTNWGSNKNEAADTNWDTQKSAAGASWGKNAVCDQPENTATAWGKQQTRSEGEQDPKWGKPNKDGDAGSSWGRSAVCDQSATAWGKQKTHSEGEQEPKWGKPNNDGDAGSSWNKSAVCEQPESTESAWGKQQTHNDVEQESKWGKPNSLQVSDGGGSPIEKATTSQGWGLPNEKQQKWEKPQTPQHLSPKESGSQGWGSLKETSSQGWGSPRDTSSQGWGSSKETSSQGWGSSKETSSQGWGTPKSRGDGPKGWGSNNAEWKGKNRPPMSQGRDNSAMNLMFTVTRQRLDMFTSEEQDILSDIEPLMRSIRKVMHQSGYNDGDALSATDQSYVIDNVLNYHPDKAAKMGAGVDHIMVNKHSSFQDSRCFFVVSTDGSQQDFSYRKCLENFLKVKYPDLAEEFTGKYFKPRQRGLQPQTPTAETPQPTPASESTQPTPASGSTQPQTPIAETPQQTPVLEPETTGVDNAAE
ncbi:DNA-directed RNA polymerase V subunit 1 [Mercurialis annua]|uniref:DNA-directed RNA polymerase V subunit 1 n=1 Tax=Mercurialis annua TaxID=3986 RepID=UPI002160B6F0|nr:DNA-directed RNA polymerase V subunit 1 [Mercurialis annua]